MNHRSVNRRTDRSSHRQAGEPEGTGFSRTKTESAGEGNRSFAQDFNMEHSRSGAAVTVRKISAGSETAESRTSRKGHAEPMNSLSCVYLG